MISMPDNDEPLLQGKADGPPSLLIRRVVRIRDGCGERIAKDRDGPSNDTLCLSRFSMALSGSQTNPVSGTSFLGPLMVRYANGIVKSLSAPSGFWAAGEVLRRRVVNGQSTREVIVETARRCHAARGGGRWTCKACTRERSRSTSAFASWRRRRSAWWRSSITGRR